MKTRIISALVGIVVLIGVVFCPITWVFSVAATLLSMIAVWELLHNTGLMSQKWLALCGMLFAGAEVLACTYAEWLYAMHPVCGWLPLILLMVYACFILLRISFGRLIAYSITQSVQKSKKPPPFSEKSCLFFKITVFAKNIYKLTLVYSRKNVYNKDII